MRKRMWMGTRGYETWVPVPKISPGFTRSGFSTSTGLLNGGTTIRASRGAHNVYALEWNSGSWDDIMPIRAMADGVFDSTDDVDLIWWIDPTAARRNLLPQFMATPALAAADAPPLLRGVPPTPQREAASAFLLPARSANYAAPSSPNPYRLYVPIPPGFTAHFGWIGSGSGQVELSQATATGVGSSVHPAPLDPAGGVWTNTTVDRVGATIGVEVGILGTAPVNIRAMTLRLLPIGQSPTPNQQWSDGMGHSGCQFVDRVGLQPLSVPLDLTPATATLEETGAWL